MLENKNILIINNSNFANVKIIKPKLIFEELKFPSNITLRKNNYII